MRSPRSPGFTVIELMVAGTILAVVLVALFAVVQGQQRAFYQGNLQRGAQGNARSALAFIEQRLATAGFGMDAPLAFDFTSAVAPCPALAAPCNRDRTDGNDELVFYARNARYWVPDVFTSDPAGNAWRITSLAGNVVTVNARPGDSFPAGRILQAVCKGHLRYAYFTVGQAASIPATSSPQSLPITLAGPVQTNPFRRQDQATDGCFSTGEARLFLIDRFRFHVRPVQVQGHIDPYLVLDAGLDANGDGPDAAEEVVVAEGIETFQVAYVLTNPALAPRGTVPGTPIAFGPGFPGTQSAGAITTLSFPGLVVDPSRSEYVPTSWYDYAVGPPASTNRLTDHQANIRAVRVTLVARGAEPEPAARRMEFLTPVLNMDTLPGWIDPTEPYNRARVDATVPIRNMTNRMMLEY